jgi:hypothetical protein
MSQRATEEELSEDRWPHCWPSSPARIGAHMRDWRWSGSKIGQQVQTDDRPFYGVSGNTKDGRTPYGSRLRPARRIISHTGFEASRLSAARLAIQEPYWKLVAHNETRTLLELSWPEDYALRPLPPNVNGSGRVQNV